jgi:hypothetical protein
VDGQGEPAGVGLLASGGGGEGEGDEGERDEGGRTWREFRDRAVRVALAGGTCWANAKGMVEREWGLNCLVDPLATPICDRELAWREWECACACPCACVGECDCGCVCACRVAVGPSCIPGSLAGVVATRDVPPATRLAAYAGAVVLKAVARQFFEEHGRWQSDKLVDHGLGYHYLTDGGQGGDWTARIQHAYAGRGANCRLVWEGKGQQRVAWVTSTRAIQAGEELFWCYGKAADFVGWFTPVRPPSVADQLRHGGERVVQWAEPELGR